MTHGRARQIREDYATILYENMIHHTNSTLYIRNIVFQHLVYIRIRIRRQLIFSCMHKSLSSWISRKFSCHTRTRSLVRLLVLFTSHIFFCICGSRFHENMLVFVLYFSFSGCSLSFVGSGTLVTF